MLSDQFENTLDYLLSLNNTTKHATLIDPEKQTPEEAAKIIQIAIEVGTDLILIGGSTTNKNSVQEWDYIIEEAIKDNQEIKTLQESKN